MGPQSSYHRRTMAQAEIAACSTSPIPGPYQSHPQTTILGMVYTMQVFIPDCWSILYRSPFQAVGLYCTGLHSRLLVYTVQVSIPGCWSILCKSSFQTILISFPDVHIVYKLIADGMSVSQSINQSIN